MEDQPATVPHTPFPNWLLDESMPSLSDTEWRVLCVVVRSTLGWNGAEPGTRKERDWLTQSQLKRRTGRASAAISRAIDGLVHHGLVEAHDEDGLSLRTPQERRRYGGRIMFRLAERTVAPFTTCSAQGIRSRSAMPPAGKVNAGADHLHSEQGYSESELRKAKTTKERYDKREGNGARRSSCRGAAGPGLDDRADGERYTSEVTRFLEMYRTEFMKRSALGEAPPIFSLRDSKLVEGLLQQYGYERLAELLEQFFQSDDAWVQKRGYALFCFPVTLTRLLMAPPRRNRARRLPSGQALVHSSPPSWQRSGDTVSAVSLFERYPTLARKIRGSPVDHEI